ncbi:MAG: DNA alkylation repair protein [Solobacterium sp.]|nr:DNA alkylation repair protein [Solobacterium sp.]
MNTWLVKELKKNQDLQYKEFTAKLIPNINPKTMIGVRTPMIKSIGKEFSKKDEKEDFLNALPHTYYEENLIHGYLLSNEKDYETCIKEVRKFLPYIDNWAVCDSISPKCFNKHKKELEKQIQEWITSKETYTIRFGIKMYLSFYLDDDFKKVHLQRISKIHSDEYYVKMMIAWYFATALAKQWDSTIPYLENHTLEPWTHAKTIQKAIESYRITDKQKEYLRTLK